MAAFVLNNAYLSINTVDLSDHVRQIKVSYQAEMQDKTAMSNTTHARLAGLKDWSIDVEFNQDFAASKVDATLFSLVGAASFAIEIRPDSGTVSATNPKYTGNALLESYAPMGQKVGDVAVANATLKADGTLTRATS